MKILFVNKYFFLKGGSETSFFDQADLMVDCGHKVCFLSMDDPENIKKYTSKYFVRHVDYHTKNLFSNIRNSFKLLYSLESKKVVNRLIDVEKPDIAHLHSIYHQLSPSILHVLKKRKIPIVMTLHDYKMVCPIYIMLRNGRVCDDCKNGRYYNCLSNKCFSGSILKSALGTVEMYLHHSIMKIYDLVDVFISPSIFLKNTLEQMGFKKPIKHIPHLLDAEKFIPSDNFEHNVIVYFGRVSSEKGLFTLLDAVKGMDVKLEIMGDGPQITELIDKINNENLTNVTFHGFLDKEIAYEKIKRSNFVVVPSEWYENSPFSVLEAYALKKPVVGSRLGGVRELIIDSKTGIQFTPGDARDLKLKINEMLSDHDKRLIMGEAARVFVENNYSVKKYFENIMQVYNKVLSSKES